MTVPDIPTWVMTDRAMNLVSYPILNPETGERTETIGVLLDVILRATHDPEMQLPMRLILNAPQSARLADGLRWCSGHIDSITM